MSNIFTGGPRRITFWWMFGIVAVACLYVQVYDFASWEKAEAQPPPQPIITRTRPYDGQKNVLPNAFVAADVFLPNFGHGISSSTMNTDSVKLYQVVKDKRVPVAGHVNTSGAGDSVVFQPTNLLATDTKYVFTANGIRDTSGAYFMPYEMSFTTASDSVLSSYPVAFTKVALKTTNGLGNIFVGITIGPDHRIYAGTFDGRILRYDIKPDGTLSKPTTIRTVINANKGPGNTTGNRIIVGLCFDPHCTAAHPVLWITSGVMALEHCPDWSCKLSRLSGPNLDHYQDYLVGLPRSWRDHQTFKLVFGPDGCIYFNQGSSSSTGAADSKWGYRKEHLLTAACLRLDQNTVAKRIAEGKGPLDVKTADGGHYNPFAPGAPLTLYSTGIRSGFSLLWHTNGHLYCCVNGGAAGGQAPGTPVNLSNVPHRVDQAKNGPYTGQRVPPILNVSQTQPDLFLMVEKGTYNGHPNATRGEYVLNGGNPDGSTGNFQVQEYPVGTKPDRNWHRPIWNFGESYSCNGLIEYKGNAFGGALNGEILTTRYSGGKDILAISLKPNGQVKETIAGINGFTQFVDPLDLIEDNRTGDIYVTEFGGQCLTLLKPETGPAGTVKSTKVFIEKAPQNAEYQ